MLAITAILAVLAITAKFAIGFVKIQAPMLIEK